MQRVGLITSNDAIMQHVIIGENYDQSGGVQHLQLEMALN
jgi:hypothetical protein